MGAVLLACKLQEIPRRVRQIVTVFFYVNQVALVEASKSGDAGQPLWESMDDAFILEYVGDLYYDWRDRIVFAENVILRELGFDLEIKLPYGLLINYCQVLELLGLDTGLNNNLKETADIACLNSSKESQACESKGSVSLKITQRALTYLNDSFLTPLHLLFQPNVIASLVLSMACQDYDYSLPHLWFHVFDVLEEGKPCIYVILPSLYLSSLELSIGKAIMHDLYRKKEQQLFLDLMTETLFKENLHKDR